ncbi:TPA: hypothetical protein N0F65_005794 [Lagenidium giganteum]|uniref:FYVE-type domain-containing protein n=1 Tax=Lagenidium giganteum TaxID=4803 RepID=A0AAV2YEY7_9STRA|nr:TPA: hypothetical protein N0F65_005794 [Lagenidium giganteum]
MTKDTPRRDDEFLVQHLVDPKDWVADHERSLCHVCTRAFGTFRRKHHCRMCGEVVCSNCTLHKNAMLATIGYTRVRVCMSCMFNHSHVQKVRPFSPRMTMPESPISISEESQRWVSTHLHSPLARSQGSDSDGDQTERGFGNNQHESMTSTSTGSPSSSCNQLDDDGFDYSWDHPWPKPPVPHDEAERLEVVHSLNVLDSPPEKPFDMICDLAKARLSCPMAAVSFMDEHRQWFKASVGLAHKMIPRKIAFCAYTIHLKEPVVVLDTLKDKRFERNPLVSGAAEVRFYAAAPIIDPDTGHAIGSVFVLDTRPRESCDISILERLAHAARNNLPKPGSAKAEETPEKEEEPAETVDNQVSQRLQAMMEQMPSVNVPAAAMEVAPAASSSALVPQQSQPAASASQNSLASFSSSAVAPNEQMEMLLMRLLTQNTETQQQLASQQISMGQTLGHHSQQINKLMCDFARMEAKMEAKIKSV